MRRRLNLEVSYQLIVVEGVKGLVEPYILRIWLDQEYPEQRNFHIINDAHGTKPRRSVCEDGKLLLHLQVLRILAATEAVDEAGPDISIHDLVVGTNTTPPIEGCIATST